MSHAPLAIIDQHPSYGIDIDGNVYHLEYDVQVAQPDKNHVMLDGITRNIDTLLVRSYIGPADWDIVPITNFERTQFLTQGSRQRNLTYRIDSTRTYEGTKMVNNEEFMPIPRSNGRYYISRDGIVFDGTLSLFVHRIWIEQRPYVYIYDGTGDSNRQQCLVARLVYQAWVDPSVSNSQIMDYINGCKWDPRLSNLRLRTADMSGVRMGRDSNSEMALVAIKMLAVNDPIEKIAKALDAPYTTRTERHRFQMFIHRILHEPGYYAAEKAGYDLSHYNSSVNTKKMTEEDRQAAIEALKQGATLNSLAQKYGVSKVAISRLKRLYVNNQ